MTSWYINRNVVSGWSQFFTTVSKEERMVNQQTLFYVFLIVFSAFVYVSLSKQSVYIAFPTLHSTWEHFEPNSNLYFPGEELKKEINYDLLKDWIPGKKEPRCPTGPTSQKCYMSDFMRSLERAGSYRQMTNNFLHKYPDSCSAPNHNLITNFYQNV